MLLGIDADVELDTPRPKAIGAALRKDPPASRTAGL